MANYQNLHLADKTLFNQYRTLFKTNISSAQEILDDSQLALKSFRADDHNDLASDISTLENNYYTNVPTRLNSLLTNFNNDISKIKYRGTYSSSTSYYQYNVVSYVVSGNTNLYMCKLPSGTSVISNIIPTNTTYWLYLGLQGDQGSPTIGNLKYVGNWDSSGSYSIDDVVTYGTENIYYLESTGTQYIDTGVKSQVGIKIEMDFEPKYISQVWFGSHYITPNMSIIPESDGTWRYVVSSSVYSANSNKPKVQLERQKVVFYMNSNQQSLSVNDVTMLTSSKSISGVSNYNLLLFCRNESNLSTSTKASMKLYEAKIYLNDNLIRHFIPAIKDNVPCLYDIVNNVYYYNQGTGNFIGGQYMPINNGNNVLYALKQSSPGTTPPPSNVKWVEIVVLDRRKINLSDSNLTEGDIYWQELT